MAWCLVNHQGNFNFTFILHWTGYKKQQVISLQPGASRKLLKNVLTDFTEYPLRTW